MSTLQEIRHAFTGPLEIGATDPLADVRKRIFYLMTLSGLTFGLFTLVSTVSVSLQLGKYLAAAVLSSLYLWMVIITFVGRLPMRFRIINGLLILYLVGVAVLMTNLPYNAGFVWLFTFAILCAVMLDLRAALGAVLLNGISLLLMGGLSLNPAGSIPQNSPLPFWSITIFTLSFLSLIVAGSIAVFLRGLEKSLEKQLHMAGQLQAEVEERTAAQTALQNANLVLATRNNQLAQILQTGNSLRVDRGRDALLQEIVDNHRALGFGSVVLNSINEETGTASVEVYAGLEDDALDALADEVYPASAMTALMKSRYQIGQCYFIPCGAVDLNEQQQLPVYVSQTGPDKSSEISAGMRWHAEDLLLVPLRMLSGELVGVLSFDKPLNGMRPQPDMLQALEIFAHQAAAAIENTQLYTELEDKLAEQAKTEQLLRHMNAELEHVAQMKDEFLASISHELRTPLNAVLGLAESLNEGVYGPINDRQVRALTNIANSGEHLLALINDILDLAKIEAGHMELTRNEFEIDRVCRESLTMVEEAAARKKIVLDYTPPRHNYWLNGDERRVKQILVNLLSNAVKFTREGGSVGIELASNIQDGYLALTIWDTGIGIPKSDLRRLFDPFVQLDSGLARNYDGTGLGLSLVYGLVEMHNGTIAVESEPGAGSRFTVMLPWGNPAEEGVDATLPTYPHAARSTILLVDDNRINAATVSEFLQTRGFVVVVARDGATGVEMARELEPAVILMDIQMPAMDGLEATRLIRQTLPGKDIPIIALTALAMPGDEELCLQAGADAYLSKPVIMPELEQLVVDLLDKRTVAGNASQASA